MWLTIYEEGGEPPAVRRDGRGALIGYLIPVEPVVVDESIVSCRFNTPVASIRTHPTTRLNGAARLSHENVCFSVTRWQAWIS